MTIDNFSTEQPSHWLAYEPRRAVPWTGLDLLAIIFFLIFVVTSLSAGLTLIGEKFEIPVLDSVKNKEEGENTPLPKTTTHPLAQLAQGKDPKVFAFCLIVGAGIVPIFEEFLFRLLLQGWLESKEPYWRRRLRRFCGVIPRGFLPIVFSAFLFGAIHFREKREAISEKTLLFSFAVMGLAYCITLPFAVRLLRWRVGATAKDLGWDGSKIGKDLMLGIVAAPIVIGSVIGLNNAFGILLPERFPPDPIPIFFFAIVLGFLYYRTHRLAPAIVLHMLLNASSLAMVWYI